MCTVKNIFIYHHDQTENFQMALSSLLLHPHQHVTAIWTYNFLPNAFDTGKSNTRASVRGLGAGNRDFFPHLYTALNSGKCSKLKSQNLPETNRKL
jgi:hypothetical protein